MLVFPRPLLHRDRAIRCLGSENILNESFEFNDFLTFARSDVTAKRYTDPWLKFLYARRLGNPRPRTRWSRSAVLLTRTPTSTTTSMWLQIFSPMKVSVMLNAVKKPELQKLCTSPSWNRSRMSSKNSRRPPSPTRRPANASHRLSYRASASPRRCVQSKPVRPSHC